MSIEYMSILDHGDPRIMFSRVRHKCARISFACRPHFLYIPDQALHASSFVFIKRFVMSLLIGIFYDTKYTGRM